MALNINPNSISTTTQGAPKRRARSREEAHREPATPRASVNFIPAPESLDTLIRSAVEALRRGIYWDRGSMLNLVV